MRDDILEVAAALGIAPAAFSPLSPTAWKGVLDTVLDQFTTLGPEGRPHPWLWNHLKGDTVAVQMPDHGGYLRLTQLIPPDERVWFLTEDWDGKAGGHYWVFEGRLDAAVALMDELFAFEYYVVSKDYGWLLCENHHDVLIGVGQPITDRLGRMDLQEIRVPKNQPALD